MNHYIEFTAERKEGEGAAKKPFFKAEANAEMNETFFAAAALQGGWHSAAVAARRG